MPTMLMRLQKFSASIFPTDLKTGISGSIKLNIWLAQLSGLPLLGLKQESQCMKWLILLYGIPTTILVTFVYMYLELYDLILCWPNLDNMTQNSCLTLTHVAGAYKILNSFCRFNDIAKVIEKLHFLNRKFILSPKQCTTYLRDELRNKMFLMGYATLVGFTGLLGIALLYYDPENVAGKTFPYRVYIPNWLPNDVRNIYLGLSVLLFAIQIVSIDYLNVSLMNQIRFHLNVLNLALEDLIISHDADGIDENVNVITYIRNLGDPNDLLQTILEHHCYIKSLRDDIEDIFRIPVLLQFTTSLLIFALTGFQATVHQENTNGAVMIYFYCGCILCELFFYCWFGNEVFEQNKTLAITAFSSSWYKFDGRFKKSLLLFLANAQRPLLFTAGGFMNLFLPSFSGILSRAYTYIAVLRQIYGKPT